MSDCSAENKCCSHEHKECCSHEHKEGCSHQESEHDCGSWFLEIADEAWTEVLKDKIKEHILATQNERMTQLAKIVSEGNNHRWKHKMEKKKGCDEFKTQLHQFFSQPKK